MKTVVFLLITLQVLATVSSRAEMYQWIGEDGSVTFKDTPPPKAKTKKRAKVKVYSDADFGAAPEPAPAPPAGTRQSGNPEQEAPAAARPSAKVRFLGAIEMYVTDWCPTCKAAEKYIAAKNYPVVRYDIEKDKSAERRYRELGGHGVPLILVGAQRMTGFSERLLEQYLGNQ